MATHVRKGPPKVFVWVDDPLFVDSPVEIDLSKEVVSLQVSKQIEAPAGSFSITLLPRQFETSSVANIKAIDRYYRGIKPNSLVSIGFEEPGGIMLGLVDRVTRTKQYGGRQTSQTITITGRDFGKIFTNDHIIKALMPVAGFADYAVKIASALGGSIDSSSPDAHPILKDIEGTWAPLNRSGEPTFVGATIEDVATFILTQPSSMTIPLLRSVGQGRPGDYIVNNINTIRGDLVFKDTLKTFQGNVWSYLWSAIDRDLYEMWLDTVPNPNHPGLAQPVLTIRPKPYDEPLLEFAPTDRSLGSQWGDLTTLLDNEPEHEIGLDEIVSEQLGYDDSQVFSYYMVTAQHELMGNPNTEEMGIAFPLIDLWAARLYGLRSYNTRLVNVGADASEQKADADGFSVTVRERVKEVRNRLFNWYRLNARFEAGTLQVFGRDRFRVGDPIKLPHQPAPVGGEKGMRYYCTGVSWSWSFGGHYLSSLKVTRGHNDGMLERLKEQIQADGTEYGNIDGYAVL